MSHTPPFAEGMFFIPGLLERWFHQVDLWNLEYDFHIQSQQAYARYYWELKDLESEFQKDLLELQKSYADTKTQPA